jgi:hypothetical protein
LKIKPLRIGTMWRERPDYSENEKPLKKFTERENSLDGHCGGMSSVRID